MNNASLSSFPFAIFSAREIPIAAIAAPRKTIEGISDVLEIQEQSRQSELSRLAVKAGQTETNVYTYWPDGSVYQWQNSVGQVDEVKFSTLRVDDRRQQKQKERRHSAFLQLHPLLYWLSQVY